MSVFVPPHLARTVTRYAVMGTLYTPDGCHHQMFGHFIDEKAAKAWLWRQKRQDRSGPWSFSLALVTFDELDVGPRAKA